MTRSAAAEVAAPAPRERVIAGIPPTYRWQVHFAGLLAEVALFMAVPAALLHDVRAWEWLLLPAGFVFANGVEWVLHRGPLHHPTRARLLYNRHTLTHHAVFSHENMSMRSWRELRVVLFPLYALPLLELVVVPPLTLLWWLRLRNAACLFSLTATFYYLLYELLHLSYHLPPEHPVARLAVIRSLKRHHQRHHDPHRMTQGNFNVSIPLFDWLLGSQLAD
ncbi:MAG TPA: sterol desaturase family protein [Streptosporangiaceae bacterium]